MTFEVFDCNITGTCTEDTSHHCPHLLICVSLIGSLLDLNHAVRLQYVSINTLQGP